MEPRAFIAGLLERLDAPLQALAQPFATSWAEELAKLASLPLDAELSTALAARLSSAGRHDLARFAIVDLAVATWASRDSNGVRAFERRFAALIDKIVSRFEATALDELRQRLRVKLFVDGLGGRARIRDYDGFGSLASWLKVIAVRELIDQTRTERRQRIDPALDDADLAMIADHVPDPALQLSRHELAAVVKAALAAAVTALSARERNFLRHALTEGHTLEQIAATYRVHRATVARVLARARGAIVEHVRSEVAARIGSDQLDDLLAKIDSNLDLSLTRVLGGSR